MPWRLGSGEVVVDRPNSHLHNKVIIFLPEALGRTQSLGRPFLVEKVDFGRPIGETICVPTGPGDEIVYARRLKRFGFSRFVKNRKPEACTSLVVILKKAEGDDYYVLITAFVGHRPEPEPWDRNATSRSRDFWATHALVWGAEEVIPGTETSCCPW